MCLHPVPGRGGQALGTEHLTAGHHACREVRDLTERRGPVRPATALDPGLDRVSPEHVGERPSRAIADAHLIADHERISGVIVSK